MLMQSDDKYIVRVYFSKVFREKKGRPVVWKGSQVIDTVCKIQLLGFGDQPLLTWTGIARLSYKRERYDNVQGKRVAMGRALDSMMKETTDQVGTIYLPSLWVDFEEVTKTWRSKTRGKNIVLHLQRPEKQSWWTRFTHTGWRLFLRHCFSK